MTVMQNIKDRYIPANVTVLTLSMLVFWIVTYRGFTNI